MVMEDLIETATRLDEELKRFKKCVEGVVLAHEKLTLEKEALELSLKIVTKSSDSSFCPKCIASLSEEAVVIGDPEESGLHLMKDKASKHAVDSEGEILRLAERVAILEAEHAELSVTVSAYDLLRQEDRALILNLQERVWQLEKEKEDFGEDEGDSDSGEYLKQILEQCDHPEKTINESLVDGKQGGSSNVSKEHSLCEQEWDSLKEQFENYKEQLSLQPNATRNKPFIKLEELINGAEPCSPAPSDQTSKDSDFIIKSTWERVIENFNDLKLKKKLLRNIHANGYEKPTVVQQRAVLPCTHGHDMIVQAPSGTGKTASFTISILQQLNTSIHECQALILAPTRELAQKILNIVDSLGEHMDVKSCACIGGTDIREDIRKLRNGVHVVVGTAGRVYGLINQHCLRVEAIYTLVIEDADKMLSTGLKSQIHDIFNVLPSQSQVIISSTAMPSDLLHSCRKLTRNPFTIFIKRNCSMLEGIRQYYVTVEQEEQKLEMLIFELYEKLANVQVVVFCSSKRKVKWLTDQLYNKDFPVSAMHGEMDQSERELSVKYFRSGSSRVLVSTDSFAHTIDADKVSFVINYDLPFKPADYICRIGCGGKFSREGVALNFVTDGDMPSLKAIESFYSTVIEQMPSNVSDLFKISE